VTHLDTSYLVDLLREVERGEEGPASALLERLAEEELAVSVHVLCEFYAAAELSRDPERERSRVGDLVRPLALSFPDDRFAPEFGRLLAELRRRGESISTMDLLIATGALVDGADLVTRNAREFERVPGLKVVSY
jgi:tRNA(fMet)-specific endonuclease VapC